VVPDSVLQEQGAYATFDFGALYNGYGWILPKRAHLSVGVYHARPGKAANIKQDLQNYINMNPVLNENKPISIRGHYIPLGGQNQRLNNGQVILVGDAANLADPWLGEGLCHAVKSSNIAANVIVEYFEKGSGGLDKYTDRINTQIVDQFAYARAIAGLVYRFPHFMHHINAEERSAAECSPRPRAWGSKFPTTGEHVNPRIAAHLNPGTEA